MFNLFGHAKAVEAKAEAVAKTVVADVAKEVNSLKQDVENVAKKVEGAAPGDLAKVLAEVAALGVKVEELAAKVAAFVK